MKRFLFLLIVFAFSMSAQAGQHNTCKAAHQAGVKACASGDMTGQYLAACLNDARAVRLVCLDGGDGTPRPTVLPWGS